MIYAHDLLKQGGEWLGEARAWMQRKKRNGSTVTWGSNEELTPPVTVSQIEEVAAYAAAAEQSRCIRAIQESKDIPEDVKATLLKRIDKS